MSARVVLTSLVLLASVNCSKGEQTPLPPDGVEAAPIRVKRLTRVQYRTILQDVFGEVATPPIEPDFSVGGLIAVGASQTTVSPWGVEQYEASAFTVARQILEDETRRDALIGCTPKANDDAECARAFFGPLARRLWRRPLRPAEEDQIVTLATSAGADLDDFHSGVEMGLAFVLQSPHFLYRTELGEPAPDQAGALRYTAYEMASRLSFLFWNTAPDEALLADAESGTLLTDEGMRAAAERLLASDRAKAGVRNFFNERFELYLLDRLSKDPTIFTYFSPDLGASAKEETLRGLEHIIFEEDTDVRTFLTTTNTFIDRRLAALYGVRAPSREGFARQTLPEADGRRGFLGQASFLALRAHPVGTSATLRGKFVTEVLLCRDVPPPPVNANTAIPEVSPNARTLRDRLTAHMEDPTCAFCHRSMDGIGLGFEKFDGVGRRREMDNGAPIDPSGNVEGTPFPNAWEMATVVAEHESVPRCLVSAYYQYATGNLESDGEEAQVDDLTERFANSGHRVKQLLLDIALSPGFRRATEASEDE